MRSQSRGPKLNCLLEPEPKLRILAPAPAPFFFQRLEILEKKIMVAKEVFVNFYNFNPIWVQHASIHVKKVPVPVLKEKKIIVKVSYK